MTLKSCSATIVFYVAIFSVGISVANAAPLLPITQQELIERIQQTPIGSSEHSNLIIRAYDAHLLKTAYEQYTLIWQKQPSNGSANLRRGVAAMEYWEYATKPFINELPLSSPKADEVSNAAKVCLTKAVELAPYSASANAEYGHFLFYQGDEASGVAHLLKAEKIAPKNPTPHNLLGAIYASPNPPYFLPKLAEKELRTGIHLAPSDSYPHWVLAGLFLDTRQYSKAQDEMQVYIHLAPPARAQESYVKQMQLWIRRGLGKKNN
jgi:tetratricopeptide (TPR) repeat protein